LDGCSGRRPARCRRRSPDRSLSLYKYFPDVEAILYAWHERQISAHFTYLAEQRDRSSEAGERLRAVLHAYTLIMRASRRHRDPDLAALLHRDEQVVVAKRRVRDMFRGVIAQAVRAGVVRDDVAPEDLVNFCLHALAAARTVRSKETSGRLVALTLAALRPPTDVPASSRAPRSRRGHATA
jgi:AcrR family transcriptional regulator